MSKIRNYAAGAVVLGVVGYFVFLSYTIPRQIANEFAKGVRVSVEFVDKGVGVLSPREKKSKLVEGVETNQEDN